MTILASTRMMALALAGASAIAFATPADAQWRRVAPAAGIGFAAGALIGGAIAANSYSYPRSYAYYDGYADSGYYGSPYASYNYYPSYTYSEPVYDSYAYAPAPSYYYAYPQRRYRPGLGTDYSQRP